MVFDLFMVAFCLFI